MPESLTSLAEPAARVDAVVSTASIGQVEGSLLKAAVHIDDLVGLYVLGLERASAGRCYTP